MVLRFSNIDFLFLQIKFLCDVPFPLTSSPIQSNRQSKSEWLFLCNVFTKRINQILVLEKTFL